MGLFQFKCVSCEKEWKIILRGEKVSLCSKCGVYGKRIFNPPNTPIVYEIRDKYRGVRMRQDQMRQVVQRSHEHSIKHESDEIIGKHGIDIAKKAGYLNEKGSKKTIFDEK